MNAYEAARLIDISAVRTHHGLKDIQEVVDIAKKKSLLMYMLFQAGPKQ